MGSNAGQGQSVRIFRSSNFTEEQAQAIEAFVLDYVGLRQPRLRLEVSHSVPLRARQGDIVYADGTSWDPGAGEGAYQFNGSAWTLLPNVAGPAAQAQIQFQDEGINLGTIGTVTTINFVGPSITATRVGDVVTLTQAHPTLTFTGDVTGSGTTAITLTIAADAVTLAKLQNITTDTLIGRATAGTGDPELIPCTAAGRALIDDADATAQRTTLGLGAMATIASVTLTGAVTGSGTSSIATTLAANIVGLTNLVDIATDRVIGRATAGTGDPELLVCTAAGRALIDDATATDQRTTLGLAAMALVASVTLSGDASGTGTSAITVTIGNNVVTFAKMQDIATDTLIGRSTAGTGDPEAITCTAAGRALLDDASASDQRTTLGLGAMATVASISLTGDVLGSGTSSIACTLANGAVVTATILDEAVTLAKLQLINTDLILGRATAGLGAVETIACTAAGRALIDDATAADQRATLGLAAMALVASVTLSGDVTGSGTSAITATIANNAITFAKLQDIATDTLIGRATAGTGDPEAITCTAAGRALLDDANAAAQRITLGLGSLAELSVVTLTGDVTGVGTVGVATTIANNAVTTAKILDANVTSAKLANSGVSAAAYRRGMNFTVDAKGLLTSASQPATVSTTLSAGNNNNMTLAANTAVLRYTPGVGSVLTGVSATSIGDGTLITITNLGSGTFNITHDDANSTAANRFITPGGATHTLSGGTGINAVYDSTSSRWRLLVAGQIKAPNGSVSAVGIGFQENTNTGFVKVAAGTTLWGVSNGVVVAEFVGDDSLGGRRLLSQYPFNSSMTADPGTFTDGMFWYNSTSDEYKGRLNGNTTFLLQNRAADDGTAVLARNGGTTTVQNTVVETSLYSISLNGPTTTNNKMTILRLHGVVYNNAAGSSLTFRIKFNGTTLWQGAYVIRGNVDFAPFNLDVYMSDTGALQVFTGSLWIVSFNPGGALPPATGYGNADVIGGNYGGPLQGTTSVATSGNHTLEVTAQWDAANINTYIIRYNTLVTSN